MDLTQAQRYLHRYALLVVLVTGGLIYAGGFVTTIGAGLSVPDWPLSFGSLNPTGWWHNPPVRAEHGHRLIGMVVGWLTLGLAIFVARVDGRKRVRQLAYVALGMVVVQAVLGGLRVVAVNLTLAMVHACFAQAFFCVLVAIAWLTSPSWRRDAPTRLRLARPAATLAAVTTLAVYGQLIVGAVMRHRGAGMAIPTYPSVPGGGLIPHTWNLGVTLNFIHTRVWVTVVVLLVAALVGRTRRADVGRRAARTSAVVGGLVVLQALLGMSIIWSGRLPVPTTLHVLLGALLLAGCVSATLWLARGESVSVATTPEPVGQLEAA